MPSIDLTHALLLDQSNPLRIFRDRFHHPKPTDHRRTLYFCGNSLGLQPKTLQPMIQEELKKWQDEGVHGHFTGNRPWMPFHRFLTDDLASLVGAMPEEVIAMNSLTVNLHLLMVSFYRPTNQRRRILVERKIFPSDLFAIESQIRWHGHSPEECLIWVGNDDGIIDTNDIMTAIDQHGQSLALVLLPGVQYYSGQALPMAAIAENAHRQGALVGFDLAHAVGNLELSLHDWNADFAVWCHYKYLNAGPGAVGGAFIHQRHHNLVDRPRFHGWWSHDQSSRFIMDLKFSPGQGAEAWQISNPPILGMVGIRASLDEFRLAGGMGPLRKKSRLLSSTLRKLLIENFDQRLKIMTPKEDTGCGAQISIVLESLDGEKIHKRLGELGVICDFRHPNVIRLAPAPLYNSFTDVYECVQRFEEAYS